MRTVASLESPISSLVVSPDGSTVITGSSNGISFIDLASGNRRIVSVDDDVRRLAWGPDGLLAGTSSGEVWAVGRRAERLVEALDEEISGIAVSSDGTIAVCGGEPFSVATFGRYGNEEWRGEPYKWPYCVRFSADGKQLAIGTWDGQLFVLDRGDLPDELGDIDTEYAGGPIFDAQFLPDRNVLVAGARFVRLWDRKARRYTRTRELDVEALALAIAPDGSCAIASTNDQRLRVFRLPDLEEIGRLAAGTDHALPHSHFPDYAEFCNVRGSATLRTLAFHPDGTRVFGTTEDRRIVEVTQAELQQVARLPSAPVVAVSAAAAVVEAPARASNGRSKKPARAAKPQARRARRAPAKKPAAKKLRAKPRPSTAKTKRTGKKPPPRRAQAR